MEHVEKIIDEKVQGKALVTSNRPTNTKKLFIESYGCQMNMNDSEIVAAILDKEGYNTTQVLEEAFSIRAGERLNSQIFGSN